MENIDTEKAFVSEAYSFQEAVNSFGKVVQKIHDSYDAGDLPDWPTVLLCTLLQTTALSLYQILPKGQSQRSKQVVDRRSIASLIRNLVDTHDTLDLLCPAHQSEDTFNLHRDIMGYYLSGKLHAAQAKMEASSIFGQLGKTKEWYWSRIAAALPDKNQRKRLKTGETLFYMTRKERLERACGKNASFVEMILSDLSSYVHSVPPSLWIKPLKEAFADDEKTRSLLLVWLRIANFYYAKSIDIVFASTAIESAAFSLSEYIKKNQNVFADAS